MARTGTPFVTWQLVWCHERCHKKENQAQRQLIKACAQISGASLVCLKKARQFGAWIERSPRLPYALVTDWREAQPCVRAVADHHGKNTPMQTIVLCQGRRQYLRAADWAKVIHPDMGIVHVCERDNIPDWLLDGVVKHCFGSDSLGPAVAPTGSGSDDSEAEMNLQPTPKDKQELAFDGPSSSDTLMALYSGQMHAAAAAPSKRANAQFQQLECQSFHYQRRDELSASAPTFTPFASTAQCGQPRSPLAPSLAQEGNSLVEPRTQLSTPLQAQVLRHQNSLPPPGSQSNDYIVLARLSL
mmetsp:Transcript_22948/g.52597  ORF Transcript_22948/g.52597 Transcript_22948/m.52597 type:complete len:300 (+) Transcript_22948:96-995(+)